MMPDVIDALGRLKERQHFTDDDDLVFPSDAGGFESHDKLRRRFHLALDAAGLRRIRFHDLRHAFGTAAIQHLDGFAVQGYMGHAHHSTTQRYLHHKPRPQHATAIAAGFGRDDAKRVPEQVPNPGNSGVPESNSEKVTTPESTG